LPAVQVDFSRGKPKQPIETVQLDEHREIFAKYKKESGDNFLS